MVTARDRFEIALPDIVSEFEKLDRRAFSRNDLTTILDANREFWRLGTTMGRNRFIDYLLDATPLRQHRLEFKAGVRLLYSWGDAPLYEILARLDPRAYFCHYTALSIHDLTERIPKVAYINLEQSAKATGTELQQDRIDIAFSRAPRVSKQFCELADTRVHIINGIYTDGLGVIEVDSPLGNGLRVTNIERTLIDVTVRPVYAGSVWVVLEAFSRARDAVSVNKLAAMLRKLDYRYPYHQAIGFYLERAGYRASQLDMMREFPFEFDFYLTHKMEDKDYDRDWRLYYPRGF